MKNILIISGHTNLNDSYANKTILEELTHTIPEAEYVYLDTLYPDFRIDVETEQQRLIRSDVIIFQFPLFWYSTPSILNRYVEEVFKHGFSHGTTGNKLIGKQLILSFTSGAPEEMYQKDGLQNYPIEDFLPPYKQMANLCRLKWGGFVYTGGMSYANRNDEAMLKTMHTKAVDHANRLIKKLKSPQEPDYVAPKNSKDH